MSDLTDLIAQCADRAKQPDPDSLTNAVVRAIRKLDDPAPLYREAVRYAVLAQITRDRVPAPTPTPQTSPVAQGSSGSSKWERIKQERRDWRSLRFFTGNEWKFARDLTRDDVLELVETYQARAHAATERAAQFKRIAALMDEHGVTRLGDLPEGVEIGGLE